MDFSLPADVTADLRKFATFLSERIRPQLSSWYRTKTLSREFFRLLGVGGWFGIKADRHQFTKSRVLRETLLCEELAKLSPGLGVAALAHTDLGAAGLILYGSGTLIERYGTGVAGGQIIMCLGNTENHAGSDVAAISSTAEKVEDGWLLNGTKAYVTNGYVADLAVVTAVSDPAAPGNRRLSMYLVDLNAKGVRRRKLNKQVWVPSDLTRLDMNRVFVPDDHLLGDRGQGLQQVLNIFTRSRVPITGLTLGTAVGAFDLAVKRARNRRIFGRKISEHQAKAFEIADLYSQIEASRMLMWRACWKMDREEDFRQASSIAKYFAVNVARQVGMWAADLFGAASVMAEHPIHKYPMDAWASSLGEGTQDVQKLIIFRELMKKFEQPKK